MSQLAGSQRSSSRAVSYFILCSTWLGFTAFVSIEQTLFTLSDVPRFIIQYVCTHSVLLRPGPSCSTRSGVLVCFRSSSRRAVTRESRIHCSHLKVPLPWYLQGRKRRANVQSRSHRRSWLQMAKAPAVTTTIFPFASYEIRTGSMAELAKTGHHLCLFTLRGSLYRRQKAAVPIPVLPAAHRAQHSRSAPTLSSRAPLTRLERTQKN